MACLPRLRKPKSPLRRAIEKCALWDTASTDLFGWDTELVVKVVLFS